MTTTTRFSPKTLARIIEILESRRASVSKCVETLRIEAADALLQLDRSALFDQEESSAEACVDASLILIQRAERRVWEFDQALARIRDGSYGYCGTCGTGIPIERLRALPETLSCVECSRAARWIRARARTRWQDHERGQSADRRRASIAGNAR